MMQKRKGFFNSISSRLTINVLLVSVIVFLLSSIISLKTSRDRVEEEAIKHAHSELQSTIQQIEIILKSVETVLNNTVWLVSEHADNPEYMLDITRKLLTTNDFIHGCAVAFEPYYFNEHGRYYSPYSFRDKDGTIVSKQLGNDDYDYHHMDWYQIPKLLDKSYWCEPYYDDGGGEMMMTTYSKPLYDREGRMFAVLTADLSLHWLTNLVEGIKAFPDSENFMISRAATYLVHPDPEMILNETIYSANYGVEDEAVAKLQDDILNGIAGQVVRMIEGNKYFQFYSPVETTEWTVAIRCPYKEVFAGVRSLSLTVIILAVLSLLFMILVCYKSIRKITGPIEKFASAAVEIAGGDFNVDLPEIKSNDELKTLRDSFEFMQTSLNSYITELKATTAKKERIESELRIASFIQMGMIPKMFPAFPEREDLDLYATLVPAKEVGGDLYDFFIQDEKFYFIVGDVSGKGVPASLVMAVTCRLFRTIASHSDKPESIIASLNDSLSDKNESSMFCTAFLGILDLKTGILDFCNAGHNAPVVRTENGDAGFIEVKPNLPLGVLEGISYEGQSIALERGTMLYLYTDGVTEAENNAEVQYSDDSLVSCLSRISHCDAKTIVEQSYADVTRHVDGAEPSDDITILCFKFK